MFRSILVFAAAACLSGCGASYVAPGRGADMRALGVSPEAQKAGTPGEINASFDKKPLAGFPAGIAVARIQSAGYKSATAQGWGGGAYSVVTTRDVESDDATARLTKLPMVRSVGAVSRMLLPHELKTDRELRQAAAQLQADMLLVYTFDTTFHDRDLARPVSVVTLGLSPTQETSVVTTASAVLLDTRNGFIYGVAEASARRKGLATAWNTQSAIDGDRQKTEAEAYKKLVDQFETVWTQVVQNFGPNATPATPTPAAARVPVVQ